MELNKQKKKKEKGYGGLLKWFLGSLFAKYLIREDTPNVSML